MWSKSGHGSTFVHVLCAQLKLIEKYAPAIGVVTGATFNALAYIQ